MSSPSRGIYIFHESSDSSDTLYCRWFDGQTWTADTQLYNPYTRAVTHTDSTASGVAFLGFLWCFYRRNGQLHYNLQDNGIWQNSTPISGAAMSGSPSAVVWQNAIYVFYQGAGDGPGSGDSLLHYITFDGTNFSGDTLVPIDSTVGMSHSPSALSDANASQQIEIYRQAGGAYAGQMQLMILDPNQGWLGDWQVAAPPISNSPSAVVVGDKHMVFFQGQDQNGNPDQSIQYITLTPASQLWNPPETIPDAAMNTSTSPAAAVLDGRLYCFFRIWGTDQTTFCAARVGAEWQEPASIPGMWFWDSPGVVTVT